MSLSMWLILEKKKKKLSNSNRFLKRVPKNISSIADHGDIFVLPRSKIVISHTLNTHTHTLIIQQYNTTRNIREVISSVLSVDFMLTVNKRPIFLENSRMLFQFIYCAVLTRKDPRIAAVRSSVAYFLVISEYETQCTRSLNPTLQRFTH